MRAIIRVVLCFTIAVSVFSCKKESKDSNTGYYFTAKFGDTNKVFKTVYASKTDGGYGDSLLIIAGSADTTEAELRLWSNQKVFAAGNTYVTTIPWIGKNNDFIYDSQLGSTSPLVLWDSWVIWTEVQQNFTCTLTEVTATCVRGTFSALLYQMTDGPGLTITVTDGQFYVPFE
jgi:hypothetical protein